MKTATSNLQVNEIMPNGDCGLIITFAESEKRLQWIHRLADDLLAQPLPHQLNVIAAMESLVLYFAAPVNSYLNWHEIIESRITSLDNHVLKSTLHTIPVCYDADFAVDLQAVCDHLVMTEQELIERHTSPIYQVAMLGFLPGFAYLQGNHNSLNIPRKSTPAVTVVAGSVAIANDQTGIYSLTSPGGWHVIGCTPVRLLDWEQQHPMVFKPLDQVKFKAINLSAYNELKETLIYS